MLSCHSINSWWRIASFALLLLTAAWPLPVVGQDQGAEKALAGRENDLLVASVRFQLLDQHDRPIEKRSFSFGNTGSDEKLESLGDGLYQLSFQARRRRLKNPRELQALLFVGDADLLTLERKLTAAVGEGRDEGVIRVHRFDKSALKRVTIRIADLDGNGVAGATVVSNPKARKTARDAMHRVVSNKSGIVELDVYPMKYYVYALHDSYLRRRADTFDFSVRNSAQRHTLTLHPFPCYEIQLEWLELDVATDQTVSEKAVVLKLKDGTLTKPNEQPGWIKVVQVNSRAGLHFPRTGLRGEGMPKVITASMVVPPGKPAEEFRSLKLSEPIEVCPYLKPLTWTYTPNGRRSNSQAIAARDGDIVIGVIEPSGRSTDRSYLRFKAFVRQLP